MARLEDIKMEVRQIASPVELAVEVRLKLIESAHVLIRELGGRSFNVSDRDEQAYESALAFLQMQYELEKPVVVIREPKTVMPYPESLCKQILTDDLKWLLEAAIEVMYIQDKPHPDDVQRITRLVEESKLELSEDGYWPWLLEWKRRLEPKEPS